MTFYGKMQSTAIRLLNKYGQTAIFRVQTVGAYDTTTGSAAVTNTDYNVKVALLEYRFRTSGFSTDPKTMIIAGDKNILMAPLDTNGVAIPRPIANNIVIVDGQTWTIQDVKMDNPAGTIVLFDLHGRT